MVCTVTKEVVLKRASVCEFHPPVRQSDVMQRAAIVMPGAVEKVAAGRFLTLVLAGEKHSSAF